MARYAIGESVRLIYTPSATSIQDGFDPTIKATVSERDDGKFALAVDTDSSPVVPNSENSATLVTPGTRVRLDATDIPCSLVRVTAKTANTGKIYLGYSNVSSTDFDFILESEDSEYILTDNVNKIYIDADTSSQVVNYTYFV